MRWLLLLGGLLLASLAHAVSRTGNRVLVVLEDVEEKFKYSKLWQDLEGIDGSTDTAD